MLHALASLVAPAMMERLTLVTNHVLAAEPAATQRLAPHRGRTLQVELAGWPTLLPPPPRLAFRITPAGLLEWSAAADDAPSDLHVRIDAANPALLAARVMAGEPPAVEIAGDAVLATDVHWLLDNVRWDVQGDLERVFGARIAREIARAGSALARALRQGLKTGAEVATRLRPGGAGRGGA